MRFPLVNKMHCHGKQDVEQGLPKCARRLGGIPFKEGEKGEPSQGCVPQFLCTLLHEKWVKMVRYPGDLNAPESSIFYGIRIQGNVDIAGRSVRSRGVVSVQGQSDFACPNKKSACPYSRSPKGPRVPWRPSPWSRWRHADKTAEGREKVFKNILGCFKICWGPEHRDASISLRKQREPPKENFDHF